MDFKALIKGIIEDAEFVGEEAITFGEHLLEFAGLVTPKALPVVTDVLTDIAQGGVTTAQATQQIADATDLFKTAQGAISTIKANDVMAAAQAKLNLPSEAVPGGGA